LVSSLAVVEERLAGLLDRALSGLGDIPGVRLLGSARRRTSTISFVVEGRSPREIAGALADEGIAVWAGDNYAYELMRRFGLGDSGGGVRASIVLYNDGADVDRLLEAVARVARR
jgi:cysteine desulfurase/selenocysteine lyase